MRTFFNFELAEYNSFKINIKAKKFIEFQDPLDYKLLKLKPSLFVPPIYILGGGFNSLFTKDFEGTILKISNKRLKVLEENDDFRVIEVGAGEDWNDLVNYCLINNLYGLENLIDIPGNVGSAPIQNIGAYGAEVSDVIESVNIYYLENGEPEIFTKKECEFGYRTSIFKTKLQGKVIIKSVIFKLFKSGKLKLDYGDIKKILEKNGITNPNIKDVAKAVSEIRSTKLPDPNIIGNAGSFFKNPIIDSEFHSELKASIPELISYPLEDGNYKIAAGWLIEKSGWKGRNMGSAAVHHQQALVLINSNGKATGKEIIDLANTIIEDVKEKFGVILEPEVNIN